VIDELHRLIEAEPAGTPVQWDEVEARLGTRLPSDYKRFVDRYGTGAVGDFLYVLTPATDNPHLSLFDQSRVMLDGWRELRANWPDQFPFATHPEPGGLLPWAVTDNGDELYWLTRGLPDQWPTVISSRGMPLETHWMTATELLAGLITGRVRSNLIESLDPTFSTTGHTIPAT